MTYPLPWIAAGLAGGILLGYRFALPLWPAAAAAALAAVAAGCQAARHRRRETAVCVVLCAVAAGAAAWALDWTKGEAALRPLLGQNVQLEGRLMADPDRNRFLVSVDSPAPGRVQMTVRGDLPPGLCAGDRVSVGGVLERAPGPRTPGGFDPRAYLARQGVPYVMTSKAVALVEDGQPHPVLAAARYARERLEAGLHAVLPEERAGLLSGLVFGSRSHLPADLAEAFRRTGTYHILAVSGSNIAIFILPIMWLLRRCGCTLRAAAAVSLPLVFFYCLLTGASPSVLRASVMAGVVLLSYVLYRRPHPFTSLGAAAIVLLMLNPGSILDVGFQLSFAATAGILGLHRPLFAALAPLRFPWLRHPLSATLAAQAAVDPLSLRYFGGFSLVAPLANLVILPILAILVPGGLAVSFIAAILPAAAAPLALPLDWLLFLLARVTTFLSGVPFAYLRLPVPAWSAVAAALLCTGLLVCLSPRLKRPAWVLACLPLPLLLLGGCTLVLPLLEPARLRVTLIDAGMSAAAVIDLPDGRTMLVDGGGAAKPRPGADSFDAGKHLLLPYMQRQGYRRLDWMVLTGASMDRAGGLDSVAAAMPVGQVWELAPVTDRPSVAHTGLREAAVRGAVPWTLVQPGESSSLGGVKVEAGRPSSRKGARPALELRYGQVKIRLGGGPGAFVDVQEPDGRASYRPRDVGTIVVQTDGRTVQVTTARQPLPRKAAPA